MRLIDADALMDKVVPKNREAQFHCVNVKDIINAPTVEERKKGRWTYAHHTWFCDQCGKNPTRGMGYVQRTKELFSFCPNCGADMRGDQL